MPINESDPTEMARRLMVAEINANPGTREYLESIHGKGNVWDTKELGEAFDVMGFLAPFCRVTRKSDGKKGLVEFQHHPRYYYNFLPD